MSTRTRPTRTVRSNRLVVAQAARWTAAASTNTTAPASITEDCHGED